MAGWQSGYAAACKAVYAGSIPASASIIMENYILVSGGFDPIHEGHLDLINNASKLGNVIVIVNSDQFLLSKKGYAFMNQEERLKIVKNIKNVNYACLSIDKDFTVNKTIDQLVKGGNFKISSFANGGDRKSSRDIPEAEICKKHGIKLIFDIGGKKVQSSSFLTQKLADKILNADDESLITKKPWGYFRNFIYEDNYLLKKMVIYPHEAISFQSHKYRDEHWILVRGEVEVIIESKKTMLRENEYLFINSNSKHRMTNNSESEATIIEIQTGPVLSEEDIDRIKDKYKRKN